MATKKKKKTVVKKVKKVKKSKAAKAAKKVKKPSKKNSVKKAVPKKTGLKKSASKKNNPKNKPTPTVNYDKAVTPLGDRLLVKVESAEKVTAGGLIIPATSALATGYLKARVLAVGSGGRGKKGQLRPLDVQVGDQVLFFEHAGTKIQFNSEELQIIHESDVMGILQDSK